MNSYFKILHVLTIILFLGITLSPMINERLSIFKLAESREYKKKAEKPNFNIRKLDKYTIDYDKYYTDNFNLRENFISITNQFNFSLFRASSAVKEVIVGKKWLVLCI